MKLMYPIAALALIGMMGVVPAEPAAAPDESTHTLPFESALGTTYFIKCKSGKTIVDCKGPSLWEQSNDFPGLQTTGRLVGAQPLPADTLILA